jgi:hypothetical protein
MSLLDVKNAIPFTLRTTLPAKHTRVMTNLSAGEDEFRGELLSTRSGEEIKKKFDIYQFLFLTFSLRLCVFALKSF